MKNRISYQATYWNDTENIINKGYFNKKEIESTFDLIKDEKGYMAIQIYVITDRIYTLITVSEHELQLTLKKDFTDRTYNTLKDKLKETIFNDLTGGN